MTSPGSRRAQPCPTGLRPASPPCWLLVGGDMATKTESESGTRRPGLMDRFRTANAGSQFKQGAGGVAKILAMIVTIVTGVAAAVLVLHIVFVMFQGNP